MTNYDDESKADECEVCHIERGLIGSILLGGEAHGTKAVLACVVGGLKPCHFAHTPFGPVFAAMTRLARRGEPVDMVTVTNECVAHDSDEFGESGGVDGLVLCMETAVSETRGPTYAVALIGLHDVRSVRFNTAPESM